MSLVLLSTALRDEADLVLVRQRTRLAARLLQFEPRDQTRIATAASEIARNAVAYAGGGKIDVVLDDARRMLCLRIADHGGGIPHLPVLLDEQRSRSARTALGMEGARRLMDDFQIESSPAGTTVTLGKRLPASAPSTDEALERIRRELAFPHEANSAEEVKQQNRELLRVLDELRQQQEELQRLNGELEETSRGVVALYAELEERAQREQAAREIAEEAVLARDAVLSIVSHDLRNPLGAVLTGVAFLLDIVLAEEPVPVQPAHLRPILRAAHRANRMIDDLLDVTRIESGTLSVAADYQPVAPLLAEAMDVLRPSANERGVRLEHAVRGDPAAVAADHGRILQVFANIGGNAIKFTPPGGRVLLVAEPAECAVRFSVCDTGPGMDSEQMEHVFDRFWQAQRGDRRGVGLGLSIVRGIVEAHGGSIDVRSVMGEGATFSFTLPLFHAEGAA